MIRYLQTIATVLIIYHVREYVGTMRFTSSERNCTDYRQQPVAHGERFRPINQDACTTCLCDNGSFLMCVSKLCSAPKGCDNPEQVYDKCCEFDCADVPEGDNGVQVEPSNVTILEPNDEILNTTNLGLRLVASTVTSFLILALLLFMIHRLRQRRLLLMIRRINGSQLSGSHFGPRRYSIDDDGSVGYLTRQDQVDFAPYDEPPPPYTFWKPPESFYPQEEAPPPYEVLNNNNNINSGGNTTNSSNPAVILHNHRAIISGSFPIPSGIPPISAITPNLYQLHSVAPLTYSQTLTGFTSPGLQNGIIPSLTQVSLHTNNFQMNNLDQDNDSSIQRHVVPLQELNVVGSISSLNSSQSELNESQVEPASNSAIAIRSDAIYEDYQAGGMIAPLTPTAVGIPGASLSLGSVASAGGGESNTICVGMQPVFSTGTYNVRRPKCVAHKPSLEQHAVKSSPFKCHSCSDVVDCSSHQEMLEEKRDTGKRCSLQPNCINLCQDPTTWLADGSETSSSSSPTYDRTTVSPTSSDSSSIDYSFGQTKPEMMNMAVIPHLPRRTNSDTQFAKRKMSSVSLTGNSSSMAASTMKSECTKSSSLDRTLGSLRAKMSLKKKTKGPSKLRRLLGGLHSSSELSKEDRGELDKLKQSASVSYDDQAVSEGSGRHLTSGVKGILAASHCKVAHPKSAVPVDDDDVCASGIRDEPVWRAPRILYVSDGDISLRKLLGSNNIAQSDACTRGGAATAMGAKVHTRSQVVNLTKKIRPHSYDFADLHAIDNGWISTDATTTTNFSIKENEVLSSGDPPHRSNSPTLATSTTDCCCSFSSGRLGSSLDSFTCTCSSRASFGSSHSSSSPSREGPASPGSLCSPVQCSSAMAEPPSSPEENDFILPLHHIVRVDRGVVLPLSLAPAETKARSSGRSLARSASICSETGERKHRRPRQLTSPPPSTSSLLTYSHSPVNSQVVPAASATRHGSCIELPLPSSSSCVLNDTESVSASLSAVKDCSPTDSPTKICDTGVSSLTASDAQDCNRAPLPHLPATALAVANRVRITIGSWKGSHESYI